MCRELLRLGDELLINRVHDPALDEDGNRHVVLVADDRALHCTLRHDLTSLLCRTSRRGFFAEDGLDTRDFTVLVLYFVTRVS